MPEIPVLDAEQVAVSGARRYCGWHVTPVITDDEIVLDGPSGDLLIVPTLRLIGISEIIEDGVTVDPANIEFSSRGLVRKVDGCWWTHRYGGIVVKMTHGFADAPDWWSAVESYMTRTAEGGVNGFEREVVGPFTFRSTAAEEYCAFSAAEKAILDLYRLEPVP